MKKIYFNGTILTMEEELYAEAVCIQNGIIKAVGTLDEVMKEKDEETEMVNLEGKTLLPGFIDAHSHITAIAQTLGSISLENTHSFRELKERMRIYLNQHDIKEGEWISGFGYDQNELEEHAHPTKELLDECFPHNPVIISHKSGHMGVINSLGLKILGIDVDTCDPEGGVIGRNPDTHEPNGYLEEVAFTMASSKIPSPSLEEQLHRLKEAEKIYLQNGITTAQDGVTKEFGLTQLIKMSEQDQLTLDVVGYLDIHFPQLCEIGKEYIKHYHNHFKIGGYKTFLDGSPQGRTAWMSIPYQNDSDYCGYPVLTDEELMREMKQAIEEEMQILIHCNGDAACEQMIRCYQQVTEELEVNPRSYRPVMIHAQLVRKDQLKRMKELGIIPSFFVSHTYYWGDVHIQNFGLDLASSISPARSACELNLPFTFHQDTPVILLDMLETIWCAVNRTTKEGVVLGEEERITPLEALKAVTIHAAHQYFEEMKKGSIKVGKDADFVILDQNPLVIDPSAIRTIQVLETIKKGVTVYAREVSIH